MNQLMRHRGPDDEGIYVDRLRGVGLVRRLSVIDATGGHQPASNEDRTVWGILSDEICNQGTPAA